MPEQVLGALEPIFSRFGRAKKRPDRLETGPGGDPNGAKGAPERLCPKGVPNYAGRSRFGARGRVFLKEGGGPRGGGWVVSDPPPPPQDEGGWVGGVRPTPPPPAGDPELLEAPKATNKFFGLN